MNNKLVSVIIPAYNASKTIEMCLNSICTQTYKNIEIICIDDCSSDDTFNIIKKYSANDNRLIAIRNDKNKMVGYCRNYCINIAKGDYILFVDADDFCENTLIEKALEKITSTNSDICFFNYDRYDSIKNAFLPMPWILKTNLLDLTKDFFSINDNNHAFHISTVCPMKLFKTDFIKKFNIRFAEGIFGEDAIFTYNAIWNASKITYILDILYHYRVNQNANQTSSLNKRPFDALYSSKNILQYFNANEKNKYYLLVIDIIHRLCWNFSMLTYKSKQMFIAEYLNVYKQFFEDVLKKQAIHYINLTKLLSL